MKSAYGVPLSTRYVPHVRTHRLVTGVRVISASLTVVALLALGIPMARHGVATLTMELAYLTLATALWIQALRNSYIAVDRPQVMLAIDLTVVVILLAETRGASSPFFASALFVVWAADYLIGWRGSVLVSSILLIAWFTFAMAEGIPAGGQALFVLRAAMIVTLPACFIWRRAHEERNRSELSKLALWPRGERHHDEVIRAMLESAAELTRAGRVVMIWEDEEEPWVHVAHWQQEAFEVRREPPESRDVLLSSVSGEASFLSLDGAEAILFQPGEKFARPHSRLVLDQELRFRIGDGPVTSVFVRGVHVAGRLYFHGQRNNTADDLTLAEIVARLMAAELDRLALVEAMRARAAADERVRLAGNLHDGLLQSMTAVSVQLAALERSLGPGSTEARESLLRLRQIVADDQRELRDFVVDAREEFPPASRDLEYSLRQFVQRFERRWGIDVQLEVSALPSPMPLEVADGIYGIVHEGLANAAKHAGAERVRAEVGTDGTDVRITIHDDGRGFPFYGRYDLAALMEQRRAPVALRQRVMSLRGDMIIDSSGAGSRLEIRLPT